MDLMGPKKVPNLFLKGTTSGNCKKTILFNLAPWRIEVWRKKGNVECLETDVQFWAPSSQHYHHFVSTRTQKLPEPCPLTCITVRLKEGHLYFESTWYLLYPYTHIFKASLHLLMSVQCWMNSGSQASTGIRIRLHGLTPKTEILIQWIKGKTQESTFSSATEVPLA